MLNKIIKQYKNYKYYNTDKGVFFNEDAIQILKNIKSNSIDLVVIDPPYGTTDYVWDKFDNENSYIDFMVNIFCEIERVLKNTGSFYFFHNDFLKIVELQNAINNTTNFKFKQFIVWNKRFEGCEFEDKKNATLFKHSVNYPKYAEYCLYYTFESDNQSELIKQNKNNFNEYKSYIKSVLDKKGYTYNTEIIVRTLYEKLGYKSMQSARSISQRLFNADYKAFGFLLKKHYDALFEVLEFDKSYTEIENMINDGKKRLEILPSEQHIFNNLKTHHSVWNYNNVKQVESLHPTQKPIELIENIILHSSNKNMVVLDCFAGSGTLAKACENLNRQWICIEKDKDFYEISRERVIGDIKDEIQNCI